MTEHDMAAEGLITIASAHSVGETIDRLAALATARGIHIFARVDHSAGAAAAGMALRPTQLLIFGSPTGGTPLMRARQSSGIDLPIKALAFEDAHGQVWLAYNDPEWIARRHGLGDEGGGAVAAMATGLAALTRAAATP
jgi:uncharacterized protein (DUF302 family)